MEKEKYRLDKTLSDYKGRDPLIHRNRCDTLISCILDVFVTEEKTTDASLVRKVARNLRKMSKLIKEKNRCDTLFTRALYLELVAIAMEMAIDDGLLPA